MNSIYKMEPKLVIVIVVLAGIGMGVTVYYIRAPPTFDHITGPSTPAPAGGLQINMWIDPAEVRVGEPVTIWIEIQNTGVEEASRTITLLINGIPTGQYRHVTLGPWEKQTITFTATESVEGTYVVGLGGVEDYPSITFVVRGWEEEIPVF